MLRIVQQLLLVPLFLGAWGIDTYNDWLLINAGTALITTLDSGGIQPHFTGLMQEQFVRGDLAAYHRTARIACFTYLVTIVALAVVLAASGLIVDWLGVIGVGHMPRQTALWTFALVTLNIFAMLPMGAAQGPYRAHGEYDRGVAVGSIIVALQIVVPGALLMFGRSSISIAWGLLACSTTGWAIVLGDQRLRYGKLPWGLAIPTAQELRTLTRNWVYFMVQPFASWLTLQGPLLVLGHLAGPTETVTFSTARTISGIARQITHQFAYPFGFEVSLLLIREDAVALGRFLKNAVSAVGIAGGLLAGIVIVASGPLSEIWLHGRIEINTQLITALSVAVVLSAPAQVFLIALNFSNRPRVVANGVFGYAVIGLLLSMILVRDLGATGVAIGLGVGETVAIAAYVPFQVTRQVGAAGLSIVELGLLRTVAAAIIGFSVALGIELVWPPTSYLRLFAFGLLWAVVVSATTFALLLDSGQRATVLRVLRMSTGSAGSRHVS